MHILISNLSANVINDDLIQLFSVYGEVSFSAVVRDKKTGRSKGRAFIEMPYEAQGEQAGAAREGAGRGGRAVTGPETSGMNMISRPSTSSTPP